MYKISNVPVKCIATLALCALSDQLLAEEKWINTTFSASQLWDSNFFQDPDELEEQISLLTAGVALSTNVSRQSFNARWRVRSYKHAEYEQLDETLQDGLAQWKGSWGSRFTSNLEWKRDSYLVDRWESPESDMVTKDDAKFVIAHGNDGRFSMQLGARQTKQVHSSLEQDHLNYEDREVFAALIYQTPSNSSLTLRYKSGDRNHSNKLIEDPNSIFDFDYQQVELENIWKVSSKTRISITLAKLMRKGVNNDSTGDVALFDFLWDVTPKIQSRIGYSYRIPVLGETIDTPSKVQTGFVGLTWNISSKLKLSNRIEKVQRDYDGSSVDMPPVRIETLYNIVPLAINYNFNDSLSLRLDTVWRENSSPILEREYESFQTTLGVMFTF